MVEAPKKPKTTAKIDEFAVAARKPFQKFWAQGFNKDGDLLPPSLVYEQFLEFLFIEGFGLYYPDSKTKQPLIVQICNKTVDIVQRNEIGKHIRNRLEIERNLCNDAVKRLEKEDKEEEAETERKNAGTITAMLNKMIGSISQYLKDDILLQLSVHDIEFQTDTETESYFFFLSRYIKVTAQNIEILPYKKLEKYIWKNQIIDRDFEEPGDSIEKSDVFKYLSCAVGAWMESGTESKALKKADDYQQRIDSVMSTLGYLLRGYKSPAEAKAVILVDAKLNTVPGQRNGGTGKSLVSKCLEEMIPTCHIAGETLNKKENNFMFAAVRNDTRMIHFNDVPKQFDLGKIYTPITEGLFVEKKGLDGFTIPFNDSPKILISTNFIMNLSGESDKRRSHLIEFSDFFTPQRTVQDFLGRLMFRDWDGDEWNRFYQFNFKCVQKALQSYSDTKKSLIEFPLSNYPLREIMGVCGTDFFDWIEDFLFDDDGSPKPGAFKCTHERASMFRSFNEHADETNKPQWFYRKLAKYCKYKRIHVNYFKCKAPKTGEIVFEKDRRNSVEYYMFNLESEIQKETIKRNKPAEQPEPEEYKPYRQPEPDDDNTPPPF